MINSESTTIQNQLRIVVYLLSALSVCSCIIRNDYNVIFSFLILIIVNKYFPDGPKYYSKIIFQLLVGLVIVDCIWLAIIIPYWNSDLVKHNEYWESLSTIHTFTLILAFIEIGVKLISAVLISIYVKNTFDDVGDLFTLHYDPQPDRQDNQLKA